MKITRGIYQDGEGNEYPMFACEEGWFIMDEEIIDEIEEAYGTNLIKS